MKLDNYTVTKIQDQISNYLFIKWLKSKRDDWQDEELLKLWDDYHRIIKDHFNAVD